MTCAMNLKYGGAISGPAGTGKTESIKDFAKALGISCIVFNCSETLEYKTFSRFFLGICQ
jgi:dynein heavy chain